MSESKEASEETRNWLEFLFEKFKKNIFFRYLFILAIVKYWRLFTYLIFGVHKEYYDKLLKIDQIWNKNHLFIDNNKWLDSIIIIVVAVSATFITQFMFAFERNWLKYFVMLSMKWCNGSYKNLRLSFQLIRRYLLGNLKSKSSTKNICYKTQRRMERRKIEISGTDCSITTRIYFKRSQN